MEDMLLLLCHYSVLYDAGWATNYNRYISMFISKVGTVLSGTGCGILLSWHHVHVNFCVSFPPSPISIPLPPPGGLTTSLRLPADEWIQVHVGIE